MSLTRVLILISVLLVVISAAIKGLGHLQELVVDTLLAWGMLVAISMITRNRSAGSPAEPSREETPEIIQHEPPWQVVDQGSSLGTFYNHPIPAWIKTSDGRQAYYSGITADLSPDRTACLEFPRRGELIIPPGLVYSLASPSVPPSAQRS